ncbi:hypothetical protein ACOCEA_00985 [Maribacter sp. CXY002]|uniref:hypothetical protein n=1 Tax=Maribacter luteocoastalis TaxID=3407671 RepID=UPI003B67C43D
MRTTLFALIILIGITGNGQSNLNDYKYIIIPKKFESFKNANEYQTSTLIKHLFTQKGFLAVYDDQLPSDLNANRCLGLVCDLRDESNMFITKASIALLDCNGKEVIVTQEGRSKIKEYKDAYADVIKAAMKSFNTINYKYEEKVLNNEPVVLNFRNDVKKLEKNTPKSEIAVEKKEELVPQAEKHTPKNVSPNVIQKATEKEQLYKNIEPVPSNIGPDADLKSKTESSDTIEIWYAQELSNGYQLVDSTPEIRMTLLKSSIDDVFMAQSDGKNGMVFQKNGKWIFEYYLENELVQEELRIKF